MFKSALFPLDLSQTTPEILNRAQFINQLGTRYFHLLHVLTPGLGNRRYAGKRLEEIAVLLHSFGFGVTTEILEGSTANLICRTAREKDNISYVYIPGRCKNVVYNTLLGSTASDVVRLTDKVVFVHKKRPDPRVNKPFSRIVYATGFGEDTARVLPYVKALGSPGTNLLLLHAGRRAGDPAAEKRRCGYVNDNLERLKRDLEAFFKSVDIYSGVGLPHKVILEKSESVHADLVVLGRFSGGLKEKIIGSTAEEVTGKARSSVLLIP